jgi:putative DNA primase/helicase
VTAPIEAIQANWQAEYDDAMKAYAEQNEDYQLRVTAYRQMRIARIKDSGKPEPVQPGDPPEKPILKRIVVNDSTHEALHVILSENPSGVLVCRDELTGWLASLDKPGREDSRAFYLQAWNGNSAFTVDRIGRGTIHESICLSLLGGIQPARLRAYLADAVDDGPGDDGLIQRFQLLVWPDPIPWKGTDRPPDHAAAQRVEHAFRKLVQMDCETPARFKFSSDAQELFNAWRDELESTKLRGSNEPPALIAHLSKYRSLMPSLALLFELADRSSSSRNFDVSLAHAAQAASFCNYLESHARRIYSCIVSKPAHAARVLADRIKEGKLGAAFTARDVYRKGWTGLLGADLVTHAIEILEDAGWIRLAAADSKTGRPSPLYTVNPAVFRG